MNTCVGRKEERTAILWVKQTMFHLSWSCPFFSENILNHFVHDQIVWNMTYFSNNNVSKTTQKYFNLYKERKTLRNHEDKTIIELTFIFKDLLVIVISRLLIPCLFSFFWEIIKDEKSKQIAQRRFRSRLDFCFGYPEPPPLSPSATRHLPSP